MGTELDPLERFAAFDDAPMWERMLYFGERNHNEFLILDPEKVGAIVACSAEGADARGELATLLLEASGRSFERTPDQGGLFPPTNLAPHQEIDVTLYYPNLEPGSIVHIAAPSGGQLSTTRSELSAEQTVDFTFQVAEHKGAYPVEILIGTDRKALDLWVGPLNAPAFLLPPNPDNLEPDFYTTQDTATNPPLSR